MKFQSKTTKEILEKNKPTKENKTMKNINWSAIKTNVIVLLVTGIIAFIGGMQYKDHVSNQVEAKAASIVKNVQVKVEPSK